MNKDALQRAVLAQLEDDLEQAHQAALAAHEIATHEENIAENKYDTLGLEAAYLASGQAKRVEQLRQTLITWRQLQPRPFDSLRGIELGALVQLIDEAEQSQWLFLGPPGAAFKLSLDAPVQVLGSGAPLGQLLLGKQPGDEISLNVAGHLSAYEIAQVL